VGSSRPRKKGAALAGTHVPRLFDHLLASRVVRRCPHCFWDLAGRIQIRSFRIGCLPQPWGYAGRSSGEDGDVAGKGPGRVLSRVSRGGARWCAQCNTAGVQREERNGGDGRDRERDGGKETTTGIKYSQPQPERGLNCDQTRSRIPTAGGLTNQS